MRSTLLKISLGAILMAELVVIGILRGDIAFTRNVLYGFSATHGEFEVQLLCRFTHVRTVDENVLLIQGKALSSSYGGGQVIPATYKQPSSPHERAGAFPLPWNANDPQFIVSTGCWRQTSEFFSSNK